MEKKKSKGENNIRKKETGRGLKQNSTEGQREKDEGKRQTEICEREMKRRKGQARICRCIPVWEKIV